MDEKLKNPIIVLEPTNKITRLWNFGYQCNLWSNKLENKLDSCHNFLKRSFYIIRVGPYVPPSVTDRSYCWFRHVKIVLSIGGLKPKQTLYSLPECPYVHLTVWFLTVLTKIYCWYNFTIYVTFTILIPITIRYNVINKASL